MYWGVYEFIAHVHFPLIKSNTNHNKNHLLRLPRHALAKYMCTGQKVYPVYMHFHF